MTGELAPPADRFHQPISSVASFSNRNLILVFCCHGYRTGVDQLLSSEEDDDEDEDDDECPSTSSSGCGVAAAVTMTTQTEEAEPEQSSR